MFKEEEKQIRKFREMGYSCYALAKVMTINYGTMKKYCRDNNIFPLEKPKTTAENRQLKTCELCGKVFVKKRDDAKLCSDYCSKRQWVLSTVPKKSREIVIPKINTHAEEESFIKRVIPVQKSEENFVKEDDSKDENATFPSINTAPEKTPILFKKTLALSPKKSDELVGDNNKEVR